MIIHLGDGSADMLDMNEYTAGKPLYQIKGNCDPSAYGFSPHLLSYAEGIKFFACHGHMYNVKQGLIALFCKAKENECNIALYGHTHIAACEKYDGVVLFNPGSVMNGKYGILTVNNTSFSAQHCGIED